MSPIAKIGRDSHGTFTLDFTDHLFSDGMSAEDALNAAFDWVDRAGVPHHFIYKGKRFLAEPSDALAAPVSKPRIVSNV